MSAGSRGGGIRGVGLVMGAVERQRDGADWCRDCRRRPSQQAKGRIVGLEHAIMKFEGMFF